MKIFSTVFLRISKYRFRKKIVAITVQLLVQPPRKFLRDIILHTKTYPKFVTLQKSKKKI